MRLFIAATHSFFPVRSDWVLAAAILLSVPFPTTASESTAPSAKDSTCADVASLVNPSDEDGKRIACEVPGEYRQAVTMAQQEGQLLLFLDQAAWRSTDKLVEIGAFEKKLGGPGGWLTDLREDGDVDISYFYVLDGAFFAFAEARMDGESFEILRAERLAEARPATVTENRLLRAKKLALDQGDLRCTTPPNTIVFEGSSDDGDDIVVFVLSAWNDTTAPFGGHHRYRVSGEGSTIREHYALTRGCLNYGTEELREGEAFPVTHNTSDIPTSIHAFLSLQYQKPIYVLTTRNGLIWKVAEGRIGLLQDDDPMSQHITGWFRKLTPRKDDAQ